MKKKKSVEITSIEQFEEIYLPEERERRHSNITPYQHGVALATQAIEKFQSVLK
ncbi:hypothetical protein [Syntrophotalea acetylenivorans]|uniref:hypothetical protein n=1 Tax=Syntrophotalea acetylenivorans TaxID=1842532 RepID=UPI000AC994F0|nr:hypothetical protein [Syntrophotalea acetylenivorans]